MNPLLEAADEVAGVCRKRSLRYCFIGGLAVLRWGEPRLTRDIDLTVIASFGAEEPVIDTLLDELAARVGQAREFALRHRTLLLRATNGIPVDVALGALPFEERAADRASPWQVLPGVQLLTCSAEDLVVHKVFAGRDRDWLDVEGIAARQGSELDRGLIDSELGPLLELKEATANLARLHAILDRDKP
jgi:Nucleotidyl transferase AbiEii toxin, Type IV TA system